MSQSNLLEYLLLLAEEYYPPLKKEFKESIVTVFENCEELGVISDMKILPNFVRLGQGGCLPLLGLVTQTFNNSRIASFSSVSKCKGTPHLTDVIYQLLPELAVQLTEERMLEKLKSSAARK